MQATNFNAPSKIQVLRGKQVKGFIIITRAGSLWRHERVLANYPKDATVILGSTVRDNFKGRDCYSALYKVRGYPYKV